jgi:anti-sigma regulatory factor (Ser/Thr protein kinase)
MEVAEHRVLAVTDASQVSEVRYAVRLSAERAGFSETDVHRAGIVATELASNLAKHTHEGGEVLIGPSPAGRADGLELLAIDRGPGMRDVSQSLSDGHSTSGTQGTGLGAIRRLSDDFDLHSQPGRGTVVWVRLRADRKRSPAAFLVGGVSVAVHGEPVCGDAWCVQPRQDGLAALVADGLGHGIHAAEAAQAAAVTFCARALAAAEALRAIHAGLRHTRGAAAAVAELDRQRRLLIYAGVGNISAAIVQNGTVRQAVSHNGTLGHQAQYFREYTYPWPAHGILVMHSDGLTSHWSLASYTGLREKHPAVIAGVLYRDHRRQRDDMTVVVAREPS